MEYFLYNKLFKPMIFMSPGLRVLYPDNKGKESALL